MCGIVGYIGEAQAAPILLGGLSRLEYRGYDSSGIACLDGKGLNLAKSVGKLQNLEDKINSGRSVGGTLGIGHTRWATHGKPNEENAHPHVGKRFAIVHNGIIENEQELREQKLCSVSFKSTTDTEVIVWLLEEYVTNGEDVPSAIRHLISDLRGSYALGIIDSENPDVIYAVKNKSPLLIGIGEGFNMIGSDAMAMLEHTDSFLEITDMEYAEIKRNRVLVYTSYGKKIKREPFKAQLDYEEIQKGTYPHYMLKEIEEQPSVIRRIIEKYTMPDGSLGIDSAIANDIKDADKVCIIACGTSYHAGLIGKFYLENIAGKMADSYMASEFVHNMPLLPEKPFFIIISQSGETADSRAVLVKIKKLGAKCLCITNIHGSTLSRESHYTMLIHAGPEIAVASTKAYTAQVAVLAVLAYSIAENADIDLHHELSIAANVIEGLCLDKEKYKALAHEFLWDKHNCFYIGRGFDYYVCMEAALKLKEISYIHTEGLAAGELKHGTIALIENGTPVIAINTGESTNLSIRGNIREVKSRGGRILEIALKGISSHKDRIIIDDVHEYLTPLVTIIPAHYLTYYAALERGCDIDKPRNLAKSVTVE